MFALVGQGDSEQVKMTTIIILWWFKIIIQPGQHNNSFSTKILAKGSKISHSGKCKAPVTELSDTENSKTLQSTLKYYRNVWRRTT